MRDSRMRRHEQRRRCATEAAGDLFEEAQRRSSVATRDSTDVRAREGGEVSECRDRQVLALNSFAQVDPEAQPRHALQSLQRGRVRGIDVSIALRFGSSDIGRRCLHLGLLPVQRAAG